MAQGYDEPIAEPKSEGIRSMMLGAYEIPRHFYAHGIERVGRKTRSAARWANEVGVLCWYSNQHPSRSRRKAMNVDKVVDLWRKAIVGLAVAHDKDDADRWEAGIEECLTPMLTAPVKQIREFSDKLMENLKADPEVPYLVWRAYEVWHAMMKKAPDDGIKELRRDLATQIVDLVEMDVKQQLPEAMVRALMWRSPEKLEEVKKVVESEKAAGRSVKLRGRESCLFLEAGGTEEEPAVCVQV
jgi:hypothetical protein